MRDDYARAREGRLVAALSTIRDLEAGTHDPDRPTARTTGSSSPGTKPPAPIGPVSTRREVLETCASWALLVIEERDLDSRLVADTAGNVARWLLPHAEWLSQHPEHDVAARAVYELERAAEQYRRVAKPTGRRHFAVGQPCPVVDGAGPCPSLLQAELQGHDDYDVSAIVCAHGHRWDPDQWLRLGVLLRVESAS